MNTRYLTIILVYGGGLLMGMAVIMFPAAGNIFKDPAGFGFTGSTYGALFIPMIISAILASSSAAFIARTYGMKSLVVAGLGGIVLAMGALTGSAFLVATPGIALGLVAVAIAAMGAGFGLTLSALNAFAFDLFPAKQESALTGLHVLIGSGQAGAPLVLTTTLALGAWWVGPAAVAGIVVGVIMLALRLELTLAPELNEESDGTGRRLPRRVWIFALVALLYGICEATFGNWSSIFLHEERGLSLSQAGFALAVFWGSITAGRAVFSALALWVRTRYLYMVAPFLIVAALVIMPLLSGVAMAIAGLALSGLFLSFFFPLTVSLAQSEAPRAATAASGLMVTAIMIGTGYGTFSVGAIRSVTDSALGSIFQFSSIYAVLMAILVVSLVRRRKRGDIGGARSAAVKVWRS